MFRRTTEYSLIDYQRKKTHTDKKQYVRNSDIHSHIIPLLSSTLNFQSLINQWEKMESNHPNHNGNRFTVCPATSTEYSPITRKNRVSNRFIVLCFPLSSFLYLRYAYWQPGGFLITVVCSTSIIMLTFMVCIF